MTEAANLARRIRRSLGFRARHVRRLIANAGKRAYKTAPLESRSLLQSGRSFESKGELLASASDGVWRAAEGILVAGRPVKNIGVESGTRNEPALRHSLAQTGYQAPPLAFARLHSCVAEPGPLRLVTAAGALIAETAAVHDILDPRYRDSQHLLRRGDAIRLLRRSFEAIDQDVLFAINSFCASYGHFVLTTLPIVLSFVDELRSGKLKLVVPADTPEWMTSILSELNLGEHALLRLPDRAYRFRSAIVSNSLDTGNTRAPHPASLRLVGSLVRHEPPDADVGDRIFVKRSDSGNLSSRTISNQADIIHALTSEGFRIIEPGKMRLHQQIEAFRGASVVVSAHGSTLANLVFCRPGTKVLDLMPDGWVGARGDSLRDVWAARLCSAMQLDYSVLLSPSKTLRVHATGNPTIVYDVSPASVIDCVRSI